jgi:hypothetical protein
MNLKRDIKNFASIDVAIIFWSKDNFFKNIQLNYNENILFNI